MRLLRRSLKIVAKQVLAIGLDPIHVDLSGHPELTAELVRTFIETQLERVRALGYEVVNCLLDGGDGSEAVAERHLKARHFDCVMIGAGLRDSKHLLLFEKVINVIHAGAPGAKICFNSTPADTAEAVQRWV
jgi:hypothetical protein